MKKAEKRNKKITSKFCATFSKQTGFLSLHQNAGRMFHSQINTKNAENEDFNLCLGCAASKRWSKYTRNGEASGALPLLQGPQVPSAKYSCAQLNI